MSRPPKPTPRTGTGAATPLGAKPMPGPARYAPDGDTWADDRVATLERSRKIAWTVAAVGAGIVVLQAIALVVMIPLKQAVPYTITVDKQTGYVTTTPGLTLPRISEADAVKQAFLTQYVLARETFDLADYRESYRRTLLWSDGGAAASYQRDWDRANPDGIQNRYRQTTRVGVTVKQVSMISPETAIVRFDTIQTEGAGTDGQRQSWSATLTFRATQRALSAQDRFANPLGFQVSAYRRDAELAAPVPVPATFAPQNPALAPPPPVDGTAPVDPASSAATPGAASGAASAAAPVPIQGQGQ